MKSNVENLLKRHRTEFKKVVEFNAATDKLFHFDFTAGNSVLSDELINSTAKLSEYISSQLQNNHCKYGIGGYNENRVLYKRSRHFAAASSGSSPLMEAEEAPVRSIHLGVDIWAPEGTKVFAPLGGVVHSFAFNNNDSDYGATIILQHQLDTVLFHTLYGHLSLKDLVPLQQGKYISRGEVVGHFGGPAENGNWPPHLHFQIIEDMRVQLGDYPGVCTIAEREKYLSNCPDANLILNMI